jgi:hypothetical protein
MGSRILPRLVRDIRKRARDVCEYCLLPQSSQEATFHIDHVVPRSRGGETTLDNLALACVTCSLRKAARDRALDPQSGKQVPLYNPRLDDWAEHFAFTKRWRFSGRSPTGRATIEALGMNRAAAIAIRRELVQLSRYPPDVQ